MIDNPAWWQKALDHYGIEDTQRTETDIVDRLRQWVGMTPEVAAVSQVPYGLFCEAADEIERQDKEIARLTASNNRYVAARGNDDDEIKRLKAELDHMKKLWANATIDAAAYRAGYKDD